VKFSGVYRVRPEISGLLLCLATVSIYVIGKGEGENFVICNKTYTHRKERFAALFGRDTSKSGCTRGLKIKTEIISVNVAQF
jgi:serine kinase of HPr protein (carbohydrate metabolism regulator)